MNHKSKYDIGERAIVVLSSNVEEYLKELSKNCFLTNFPKDFIDLLNDNYDACINCIRFSPALYFYLSNEFKKDINETIIRTMVKYAKQDYRLSDRAILASISTMATKPALVEHFYAYPDQLDESMYLQYYLEMQLHQLNLGTEPYAGLFTAIQSFSCSMRADFSPVIEPSEASAT